MKRTILLLLAILLWGGTSLLHAQAEAPFLPSAADARCKQWVDSVFSGLNLQEKVGQLIVTTFPAKADKQKKKQIRDLVKKYKIGGLLFAEGTPEEQAILTNIAQKNSKVPVMIDHYKPHLHIYRPAPILPSSEQDQRHRSSIHCG